MEKNNNNNNYNNNNKKKVGGGGSSSSTPPTNFDHLFGPMDPSTTSSNSTSIFGSIFPPPSTGGRRDSTRQEMGYNNYGAPGNYSNKGESSGGISNKNTSSTNNYDQNDQTVEPSYYSSSIYYGGQENYSPRTSCKTTQSPHTFKKDKDDDDQNGNDRGNWWKGSLYY